LGAEQSDATSVDSADDALLLLEAMLSAKSADVTVGDSLAAIAGTLAACSCR